MLQAHRCYRSNKSVPRVHGLVLGDTRLSCHQHQWGVAASHVSDTTCKRLTIRVGNIVPEYYLTRVHGKPQWYGDHAPCGLGRMLSHDVQLVCANRELLGHPVLAGLPGYSLT
ncbi:hypothetical protein TIFTF001_020137 [Ficus carica]|uniref:Uncharacterized protein n=1 Tax=Ficus carica TaxID=3494 RepID=A0AA88A7Z7_FICCA|nr:hypothetical protein TIFTF001_020137 [Ficus carica]